MAANFYLAFEPNWRTAPLAFWVHVPVAGTPGMYVPNAPTPVQHKGYVFLYVEKGEFELRFSSLAQLDHFIEVMETKPLPTSRQLSHRRGAPLGPNSHWLSRLPAKLKTPRERGKLVAELKDIRLKLAPLGDNWHSFSHLQ